LALGEAPFSVDHFGLPCRSEYKIPYTFSKNVQIAYGTGLAIKTHPKKPTQKVWMHLKVFLKLKNPKNSLIWVKKKTKKNKKKKKNPKKKQTKNKKNHWAFLTGFFPPLVR
jgi:hypothetical protein